LSNITLKCQIRMSCFGKESKDLKKV